MDVLDLIITKSIKAAEGDKLHRNSSESDITSAYGIYKTAHPTASIFSYYDEVAKELKINTSSKDWKSQDIELIQSKVDNSIIYKHVKDFYSKFTPLDLNKLPFTVANAYFNIYVNTPKGSNEGLQLTLNAFIKLKKIEGEVLKVDGLLGNKTKELLYKAVTLIEEREFLLTYLIYANNYYVDLVVKSPDKYLKYLKGWDNRIDNLVLIEG